MSNLNIHINGPQGGVKTRLADHLKSLLTDHPLPDSPSEICIHDGLRILSLPRPMAPITRGTYRARNGQVVRVVCTNVKHGHPVLGLATVDFTEYVRCFKITGESQTRNDWDLLERISDEF